MWDLRFLKAKCWSDVMQDVHLAQLQWEMLPWEHMQTWTLSVVCSPASRISIERMFLPWRSHRWQCVKEQIPQPCKNRVEWSQPYWFDPVMGWLQISAWACLCACLWGFGISYLRLVSSSELYSSSSCGSGCSKHGRISREAGARCKNVGKG